VQFSDLMLICTQVAVVIGSKQRYRIKSKIDIDSMQVVKLTAVITMIRCSKLAFLAFNFCELYNQKNSNPIGSNIGMYHCECVALRSAVRA